MVHRNTKQIMSAVIYTIHEQLMWQGRVAPGSTPSISYLNCIDYAYSLQSGDLHRHHRHCEHIGPCLAHGSSVDHGHDHSGNRNHNPVVAAVGRSRHKGCLVGHRSSYYHRSRGETRSATGSIHPLAPADNDGRAT